MIATLQPLQLTLPRLAAPRSEGVHVSRIIKAIAVENKVLPAEWVDPEDLSLVEVSDQDTWWEGLDDASRLRMSIGMAWEDWYVPQLGDVVYHPGEMCVDGIYMTHDGESIDVIVNDTVGICLHEVKATYKSTRTVGNLSTQWMWLAQTKAYCKGLKTTVAFLHVLFLCGDYKYPIRPVLKCWRIEYTQAEIDENWDIMVGYMRHKQLMESEESV